MATTLCLNEMFHIVQLKFNYLALAQFKMSSVYYVKLQKDNCMYS